MTDTVFTWDDLAQYKAEGRFLDGYPDDQRTFFSPRDKVHDLLVALLEVPSTPSWSICSATTMMH